MTQYSMSQKFLALFFLISSICCTKITTYEAQQRFATSFNTRPILLFPQKESLETILSMCREENPDLPRIEELIEKSSITTSDDWITRTHSFELTSSNKLTYKSRYTIHDYPNLDWNCLLNFNAPPDTDPDNVDLPFYNHYIAWIKRFLSVHKEGNVDLFKRIFLYFEHDDTDLGFKHNDTYGLPSKFNKIDLLYLIIQNYGTYFCHEGIIDDFLEETHDYFKKNIELLMRIYFSFYNNKESNHKSRDFFCKPRSFYKALFSCEFFDLVNKEYLGDRASFIEEAITEHNDLFSDEEFTQIIVNALDGNLKLIWSILPRPNGFTDRVINLSTNRDLRDKLHACGLDVSNL